MAVIAILAGPRAASADQIWIKSFTGMSGGEKPQGYRYDRGVNPQDIQVFFEYDTGGGLDYQVSFNGGQFTRGFSCTVDDLHFKGSCFATLPYDCGKLTIQVQQLAFPTSVYSAPVDIFIFNGPACLPQCDSCQLSSTGQAAGRPINVATGKLWYTMTDLALPGPFGLRFGRWYDNQAGNSGDLGVGWRHGYGAFLDLSGSSNGLVTLHDEEDRRTYFTGVAANATVHDDISGSDLALDSGSTTYTLTTWSGARSTFDSAGRLTSLADRIGNTHTIARDSGHAFRIITITDSLSRTLTFGYDASNRITSVASNVPGLPGTAMSFTYDTGTNCPGGNLCSVMEPDGNTWTYQYDASHNLTKVLDPLGHAEEVNTFSGNKCMTQSTEGGLNSLSFVYGSGTTTVTDGLSRATAYTYDPKLLLVTNVSGGPGCGCGGGQSRSFTWDPFLRKTSETDGDGGTHTLSWSYGRDVTATHFGFTDTVHSYPSPTSKTEPLSSGSNRQTTWTYYSLTDPRRDLVQTETIPSADTSGQNKTTTNTFSTQGLLTSRSEQGYINGALTTLATSSTFDSKGRLLTVDGPRMDVTDVVTTAFYPDTDSDFARRGQLKTLTDAVGNVTTYASSTQSAPYNTYDAFGHPRSITDPNGVVRQMDYDSRGRLTLSRLKGVTGDPADLVTSYGYDTSGKMTSTSLPNLNGTSYVYDGSNRLTDTVRFDSTSKQQERIHLTYDVMSQKTQEEYQVCTLPATPCGAWTLPSARTESFQYDAYGRLKEIDHPTPAGSKIVYGYDAAGNLATVQDENHVSPNTTYGYDYANRLTSVTQTLAGSPAVGGGCPSSAGNIATCYGYDIQDNLKSVTDPNTNQTTYAYDDFRRMRSQTSPVSGMTSYTYDEAGNLKTVGDANGATTTRTYDPNNRLVNASSTRSGLPSESAGWSFDDPTVGTFGVGRPTSVNEPSGQVSFTYDRRGLVTRETKHISGVTYTTSYAYDGNGNRQTLTYPSGRVVRYSFDFADRPILACSGGTGSACTGGTTYVSSATYKPFGPENSLSLGNGATWTKAWDQRYRPMENKIVKGSTIADYFYTEDAVGNIICVGSATPCPGTLGSSDRSFAYDDLNRLTTAKSGSSLWGSGGSNGYSYDSMGNMKTATLGSISRSFSYVSTLSKLSSVTENGTATSVTYDFVGNETVIGSGIGSANYAVSPRNNLWLANGFAYAYDARGVRSETLVAPSGTLPVTSTNPSSGAAGGGTVIAIYGSGFQSGATVTIGGLSATSVTFVNANQINATAPALMAGTFGDVVVMNPGGGMSGTLPKGYFADFLDVPATSPVHSFVLTLVRNGVAAGCGGGNYCPSTNVTRAQMAVFLLVSEHGFGYVPPLCTVNIFADVTCTPTKAPLVDWINQLFNEGVTGGCGGGNYCPGDSVSRATMSVFLLRTEHGSSYSPPACTVPVFADVPCTNNLAIWIDELYREGVAGGCGGGNYCPGDSVTRGQMAVFLAATFKLSAIPSVNRRDFIYSPELNLLAESSLSASPTPTGGYDYVWFNGRPIAEENGGTHWYFTDHLGTPILQTDSTGAVFWRAEYEPYGRIYALLTTDQHQTLRLPGQEAEEFNTSADGNGASDRSYNVFRWYRGKWGRYTQSDPVGMRGSGDVNLFRYTSDNPLSFYDPDGLAKVQVCCRQLRGPLFAFNSFDHHCFVRLITDNGVPITYGLFPEPGSGFFSGTGCPRINDPRDATWTGSLQCAETECVAPDCVTAAHRSYPCGGPYRAQRCPNSNTYASYVARKCGLNIPLFANSTTAPCWDAPIGGLPH